MVENWQFWTWNWTDFWHALRILGVLAVSFAGFSYVRRSLWGKLQAWTERVSPDWGFELLEAAELPSRLAVLAASVSLSILMSPEAIHFHDTARSALRAFCVFLCIWILDRFLTIFLRHQQVYPRMSLSARALLHTVLRILSLSVGALILLDSLGIPITPLLASLSLGTVGVSLALQETFSNFFSGIYLLVDQPIRVGDYIQIAEGIEGQVKKIGWRSTQILLLSNNMVILSNSKLTASKVVNFDLPQSEMSVYVDLQIGIENDLEIVESILLKTAEDVLKNSPEAVPYFTPLVRFQGIKEYSIPIKVILRARNFRDHFGLHHQYLKMAHQALRAGGILFSTPQHQVFMDRLSAFSFKKDQKENLSSIMIPEIKNQPWP